MKIVSKHGAIWYKDAVHRRARKGPMYINAFGRVSWSHLFGRIRPDAASEIHPDGAMKWLGSGDVPLKEVSP